MRINLLGRRGLPLLIALMSFGGVSTPAAADHAAPFDGPDHHFGEMVDYSMTFPTDTGVWFADWFWASRSSGAHHAQDLFAAKGTPVRAVADGTVVRVNGSSVSSRANPDGCCSVVVVHDDGWTSLYIHLNNDSPGTDDGAGWGVAEGIEVGSRVTAGQLLGWIGDSGSAEDTSPHLHFELRDPDGVIVNPFDALQVARGRSVCRVADPGPLDALLASSGLLKIGSRGDAVRELQHLARAFGHDPGVIDGIFGARTRTAVVALQASLGAAADGVVGDETRAAAARVAGIRDHRDLLDPDGRLIGWGDVGGDVTALQSLLRAAGFDGGEPDGLFGPRTRRAVRDLQQASGITVDGTVGAGTRRALAARLGVAELISCSG